MTDLDLLTEMARERRDEFLRQADERRLAAAVQATRGQQEHNSDPFLSRLGASPDRSIGTTHHERAQVHERHDHRPR